MSVEHERTRRLPPRWFVRAAWVGHRAIYAVAGGRFGLRNATADRWGMLRLKTVGRRSGEERTAILGYLEDGPDLVTLAMNGWADTEPAWWLNLAGAPRRHGRPAWWVAPDPRACSGQERAGAPMGQVGRPRRRNRCLCRQEITGDRGRHPGATARTRAVKRWAMPPHSRGPTSSRARKPWHGGEAGTRRRGFRSPCRFAAQARK